MSETSSVITPGQRLIEHKSYYTEIREFEKGHLTVPENCKQHQFAAGIAVSEEDIIARWRLVTNTYLQKRFLQNVPQIEMPNLNPFDIIHSLKYENYGDLLKWHLGERDFTTFLKSGAIINFVDNERLYLDIHEQTAVPVVVKRNGSVVGSSRVIRNAQPHGVPAMGSSFYQEYAELPTVIPGEYSQFASWNGQQDVRVPSALIRATFAVIRSLFNGNVVAVLDDKVLHSLNGYYRFGLDPIGPQVDHLGSICTPVIINPEKMVNNMKDPALANFMSGSSIDGSVFDWYTGP